MGLAQESGRRVYRKLIAHKLIKPPTYYVKYKVKRGDTLNKIARRYKTSFPRSLMDAPMLLPTQNSALRRRLDDWFEDHEIAPRVAGEFDDSALLKAFGEAGAGIFASPSVIEEEICRMYRMSAIGQTDEIKERYYAISPERRLKHESVVMITDTAPFRYPHYHELEDTPDKVDFGRLARVVAGLERVIAELAGG